jgi:hypothetical protein
MGCGENNSAAAQMRIHKAGDHRLPRRVERRCRFVQQPDRTIDRDQAGDRQAAALAGRQESSRQMRGVAQTDGLKAGCSINGLAAEKSRQKSRSPAPSGRV